MVQPRVKRRWQGLSTVLEKSMLKLDSRRYWFKSKQVWFSDRPFDITGYLYVAFFDTKSKVDLAVFQRIATHNVDIDLMQDRDTI